MEHALQILTVQVVLVRFGVVQRYVRLIFIVLRQSWKEIEYEAIKPIRN